MKSRWISLSFSFMLALSTLQASVGRGHSHCRDTWDYIVIGDGTAGAVLARELSNDDDNRVLVLEWGENRTDDPVVLSPNVFEFNNLLTYDPKYAINTIVPVAFPSQPEEQFFIYSDGRMWGGSSAHNGLFAVRGTPTIYNQWAVLSGNPRWSYSNLLPLMIGLEDYHPDGTIPNPAQRGLSGPLGITQSAPLNTQNPFDQAISSGTFAPFISDYNDPTLGDIGFSAHQQYITPQPGSHRTFSANAFHPVGIIVNEEGKGLEGRQLLIQSNALVSHIIFNGHEAVGVEYWSEGHHAKVRRAYAKKKVILCAGALASPAILERSGIGDRARLEALDIDVLVDSPHVGENLINHYGVRALISGAGNTSGEPFLHGYINVAPYMPNDGERRIQVIGRNRGEELVSISGTLIQPKSRGSVHIVDTNPTIYPNVDLNMFSDGGVTTQDTDAYLAVSFYKILRHIFAGAVISPPPSVVGDEALLAFAQELDNLSVTYHVVGTARMGTSIHDGVVDGNLHVFGVKKLMVADLSVERVIEDGNTAYAAYLIGLEAANIAKETAPEKRCLRRR